MIRYPSGTCFNFLATVFCVSEGLVIRKNRLVIQRKLSFCLIHLTEEAPHFKRAHFRAIRWAVVC
jgi:hypothetical protein